jgi:uncharacterized protein (DUF885 family)
MKKTAIALAALILFACGTGALLAQGPEDAKFKKFQDAFWDAYFKFYPTAGTLQGYAKYNDKLEDPSEGALDKFNEILDGFNQELVGKIDRMKLSPANQIEHEMFLDFLDMEFLKLQNLVPWEYNPLLYNELFVQSVRSLLVKNGGAGVAAATARAKLIPGLVKRAKDNLKTPPQDFTRAAIDQMPAIIDFYRTEVSKLSGGAATLQAEAVKAATALEDYLRFLRSDLLPKSTGNFRTGEAHLRTLRMTTQGHLPILEEIVQRSLADFNNIRRDMFLVCISFYKIMYPSIDIEELGRTKGEEQTRNTVIQGVLDKINTDHSGRDELTARIGKAATDIKAFINKHNLISLPEEDLAIEPMPDYWANGKWTLLTMPGAFEPAGPYTLFVRPIPASWSAEEADSFLEEHNNYYIDFMALQKIYPGAFVPAYFSRKDPSIIKRMFPNQGLLKGWPIFLEDMFIENGFGNYDLRTRLNQLKLMLKTVIDFQMDINVHEGSWTKDKVIEYMTVRGYMTKTEAERRWSQIVLNPGEGSQPYIGYQEILDMEKEYRKLKGANFTVKDFLQKLLSHGALPLRTLRVKMAQ